ncbi:MAG: HPr family phosphocarrier protein [Simkaniaceae bacterium]
MENLKYTKIKSAFCIANDKGLHTRPATELVKCASTFNCTITLHYHDLSVNAKSLLGILMMAAARGAKIRIEAEGEDAHRAVEAIVGLANNKFNLNY